MAKFVLAALFFGVLCSFSSTVFSDDFKSNFLKGINVTLFDDPSDLDYSIISSWGANSIRLVVRADLDHERNDGVLIRVNDEIKINPEGIKKVVSAVKMAERHSLFVVVDMHTWPGKINGEIWADFKYWELYVRLWGELSEALKGSENVVGYDLMNEPDLLRRELSNKEFNAAEISDYQLPEGWVGTPMDYYGLMNKVANEIRKVDSTVTIILEPLGIWGHPSNFNLLEELDVSGSVCYSAHYYLPKLFVEQGKVDSDYYLIRSISYPMKDFDFKELKASLDVVRSVQVEKGLCIYIGEFGLTKYTEGYGADIWMKQLTGIFSEYGWHSAYWSYSIPLRKPDIGLDESGVFVDSGGTRVKSLSAFWLEN